MDRVRIAPSLLSCDFARLAEEVRRVEAGGADLIHLDVMDGHFVPNITFGPALVSAVRRATRLPLDVHLMVSDPDRYLSAFSDAGADYLSVHAEALPHLQRTLAAIRKLGRKAGVALNPSTPASAVEWVLDDLDFLLVMTVNPGFGAQTYLAGVAAKIGQLAALLRRRGRSAAIEVDGGITDRNAAEVVRLGARMLVAGSYVFSARDAGAAIARLRRAARRGLRAARRR